LHFDATSASFPLERRSPTRVSCRPWSAFEKHLALSARPFSISGSRAPSFHPLSRASGSRLPCAPKVPSLGFGYPFDGIQDTRSLGAYFNSQRSWASPFKALLRLDDREMLSHPSFRSRAFLENLMSLLSAPQRFNPTEPAVPFDAPQVVGPGQGRLAFLGFRVSRAFLPPDQGKGFSPFPTPLILCGK
jgi:hypothetical protein